MNHDNLQLNLPRFLSNFPRFSSHLDDPVAAFPLGVVHVVILLPEDVGVGVAEHLALYRVVVTHVQSLVLRSGEVEDRAEIGALYYVIIRIMLRHTK